METIFVPKTRSEIPTLHKCVECGYLWKASKRTIGKDVKKCPSCHKYQVAKVIQLPPPESITPQQALDIATALGPIDFANLTPNQIAVYEKHLSKLLAAVAGQGE